MPQCMQAYFLLTGGSNYVGKTWQHDTVGGRVDVEGNVEENIKSCYCLFEIGLLSVPLALTGRVLLVHQTNVFWAQRHFFVLPRWGLLNAEFLQW